MNEPWIRSGRLAAILSVLSGILLALSMPGTGWGFLAWFAFVPLLLAVRGRTGFSYYLFFNLAGLASAIGTHIWFPDVLGTGLGIFLMVATGFLYGSFLHLGHSLQRKIRSPLGTFVVPVVWTSLEWLRSVLPVTREWWIEVLAKTQWTFPASLQVLSVTGFAGLSFLLMLTNSALAELLTEWKGNRRTAKSAAAALLLPALAVAWGFAEIRSSDPAESVQVAANADLANQDQDIIRLGGQMTAGDGYIADTPEMSEAIFRVNADLTRQAFEEARPSFVVWGENEFTGYDQPELIGRLGELAVSTGAYIVADITWKSEAGLHDTAILIGPDGKEAGKTAKIMLTGGEKEYGFVPGTVRGQVFDTPYGKVGLAVCWDRHVTGIVRALAAGGAGLILIPADDDFNGNPVFPKYAAADSVFRAAENRVGIVTGTTSGMSQIISPYGIMIEDSGINERGFITGKLEMGDGGQTFYTRYGDWFPAAATVVFLGLLTAGLYRSRKHH